MLNFNQRENRACLVHRTLAENWHRTSTFAKNKYYEYTQREKERELIWGKVSCRTTSGGRIWKTLRSDKNYREYS